MQLVHIFPVYNTHLIEEQPISMALTHLVLKCPEYAKQFRQYRGYKILDNSIIELGEALSIDMILMAADMIRADEIILPDVLNDGPGTIKAIKDTLKILGKRRRKYNLMAVCQGKDDQEFEECFRHLDAMQDIRCIGIPKLVSSRHEEGRPYYEPLWAKSKKSIHLLGLAESFYELTYYEVNRKIRSCDTSLLSYLIYNNKDYNDKRNPEDTIGLEHAWVSTPDMLRAMQNVKNRWGGLV